MSDACRTNNEQQHRNIAKHTLWPVKGRILQKCSKWICLIFASEMGVFRKRYLFAFYTWPLRRYGERLDGWYIKCYECKICRKRTNSLLRSITFRGTAPWVWFTRSVSSGKPEKDILGVGKLKKSLWAPFSPSVDNLLGFATSHLFKIKMCLSDCFSQIFLHSKQTGSYFICRSICYLST